MFFKRGCVVPAHCTVQDSKTNWCGNHAHVHLYEGRLLLLLCGRVCMFFYYAFKPVRIGYRSKIFVYAFIV